MKKVLLGTTALVSAGLVAQSAQAADPIELSVSGYHNWALFFANNDENAATGSLPAQPGFGLGGHDIKFSGEVHFKGKTVLDNGLEVGVRIELEGETVGDQMDENYAWISGSFGTFRFGNDDPASLAMSTAAPYLNYIFGANSASVFANGLSQFFATTAGTASLRTRFAAGGGATFATFPNQAGDDASLMYFSPVFNGFQFGVTYAPNNVEARMSGGYLLPVLTGTAATSPATTHGEVYSVGARYDGAVGDVGVTVAAGWMRMNNKAQNNTPGTLLGADSDTVNAGLVLYMGDWGVGGSYKSVSDAQNVAGSDNEAFDIGVAYWSPGGAWSAGVYYLHHELDYAAGNLVAGRAITDEFDAYRLMGQYEMGPGVSVTGTIGLDQFSDGVVNRDYDTEFVGTGIMIGF
tara:strand:- start:1091 stop:2308 length:1218 start_codon:yes stop_codon:yes gene_type:complete